MKHTNTTVGQRGEDAAVDYLLGCGMTVLARNWRCRFGELDVIARDGQTLVFVEVKSRTSRRHGSPGEAITTEKLARLQVLADIYLSQLGQEGLAARIDLVGVFHDVAGQDITHIQAIS
jgi:putative endonuclease